MSRKNTKCEEFDEAIVVEKIKATILKSIREMIREELPGLIKCAFEEELKKLLDRVIELNEENNRLKSRIDLVQTELRANNLVINWLPDASLAEVAATPSRDAGTRCTEVLEKMRFKQLSIAAIPNLTYISQRTTSSLATELPGKVALSR